MTNFLATKMSLMDFVRFMFIRMSIILSLVIYMYTNDWPLFHSLNHSLRMRSNRAVYIGKLAFIVIYYVEVKYGHLSVISTAVAANTSDETKISGRQK